jgi:crotonobetainyl-CoA:carnitine CoA-transferase CaiB-like acyl-CoA transferase
MKPGEEEAAWAASGAMFLTGRPDGPPLAAPDGFVSRLCAVGDVLACSSEPFGRPVDVDVLALLGERAALAGLRRGGDVSCGRAARLLAAADGWVAVNLPRLDDLDLLPAWLADYAPADGPGAEPDDAGSGPAESVWAAIAAAVATASAESLAERAQLLGLPAAALPRHPPPVSPADALLMGGLPVRATRRGDAAAIPRLEGLLIADLSSLWAGPVCTNLLQQAGARVVKVESVHRPDGARRGPTEFFDLLHGGQEAVALDFRVEEGRAALRQIIEAADVVVEASRPRALEQLGIFAEAATGPQVWLSITGYGRAAPGRNRVAFGDDAAVAGGLVAWDEGRPCFLADAVADPCAGLVAAAGVLRALGAGGRWLVDVSMRDVAAHLGGPTVGALVDAADGGLDVAPPRARLVTARAPAVGEHTDALLAELRSSF